MIEETESVVGDVAVTPEGNLLWQVQSAWGPLQVSINRAKPEKDPAAIALAAREQDADAAAACELCIDHAGATSEVGRKGEQVALGEESWTLSYSPYGYCTDHCCVIAPEHRPMRINSTCFENLLDFLDAYPDYFIGSNADLPIVGGSILSHDHYQGGRYRFPLMDAPFEEFFGLPGYPGVRAGFVSWPMAVVRLEGATKREVVGAACCVLSAWKYYSNTLAGIVARSRDGQHNTLTPVAYRSGDSYVMDLALRNNLVTARAPYGVFHPGEELHHIKKENIGLIEVMGLAILPKRLEQELAAVERWLIDPAAEKGLVQTASLEEGVLEAGSASLGGAAEAPLDAVHIGVDSLVAPHLSWAQQVRARHPELDAGSVGAVVRAEVGAVYVQVLESCNVFKNETPLNSPRGAFLQALEGAAFLH